jgi:hypothetical protein
MSTKRKGTENNSSVHKKQKDVGETRFYLAYSFSSSGPLVRLKEHKTYSSRGAALSAFNGLLNKNDAVLSHIKYASRDYSRVGPRLMQFEQGVDDPSKFEGKRVEVYHRDFFCDGCSSSESEDDDAFLNFLAEDSDSD